MNKYTICGKCIIKEDEDNIYVTKKCNKNLNELFRYLKEKDFDNYPEVIKSNDKEYSYKYINDNNIFNPNKGEDLITLVGSLHSKTSYNKEVSEETYKKIYEDIKNNILYLKDYYLKYFELSLNNTYMSPSMYEFSRNYSKINNALTFSLTNLDEWYSIVKEKGEERVSILHNNLKLDHYIKGDKDYLISWDNYKIDTPVLDLYNLIKNNFWELNLNSIYTKYNEINKLNDEEQKLFFVLISLVPEIEFEGNEFDVCKNMRYKLDYIYKVEEFLKPYYSTNTENK